MAVVTGTIVPINLGDPVNFGALLFSFALGTPTSTAWATQNPETGGRWQFTGTGFGGFTSNIPTTGTVTGIQYFQNNGSAVTITGVSLPMTTFFNFLAIDDINGLLNFIFAGADTISGSTAFDNLFGYGGNDTITGNAGGDALWGGSGDDTINAGADFDFLHGEDGNDLLNGNSPVLARPSTASAKSSPPRPKSAPTPSSISAMARP